MSRSTVPSLRDAMARLSGGNLQLAVSEMSSRAQTFYDRGDPATGDLFAALVVELGEEQDRRRAALEYIRLEIDGPDIGGLVSELAPEDLPDPDVG